MIDELGATSSDSAIDPRALIQAKGVNPLLFFRQKPPDGSAHRFVLANPFTCILDHLLATRDYFFCEDAIPFDVGAADTKLEMGKPCVDVRDRTLYAHSNGARQQSEVTNMRLVTSGRPNLKTLVTIYQTL
jgi:hypothetical protein